MCFVQKKKHGRSTFLGGRGDNVPSEAHGFDRPHALALHSQRVAQEDREGQQRGKFDRDNAHPRDGVLTQFANPKLRLALLQ